MNKTASLSFELFLNMTFKTAQNTIHFLQLHMENKPPTVRLKVPSFKGKLKSGSFLVQDAALHSALLLGRANSRTHTLLPNMWYLGITGFGKRLDIFRASYHAYFWIFVSNYVIMWFQKYDYNVLHYFFFMKWKRSLFQFDK